MTDMQVKAWANLLKEEELAQKKREIDVKEGELAETERSNRQKEALTEADALAKYGATSYFGPNWTSGKEGQNPAVIYGIIRDVFKDAVLNPMQAVGRLFGGKK